MKDRSLTRSMALVAALLVAATPALAEVDVEIVVNNDRLQGEHPGGSMLLFTPVPVQPGSSISHWDISATPNLLMEPFISPGLPFLSLDITPDQLFDVFWPAGELDFNIFSLNPPGTGFTDPRPFAGAPGNDAATLGEARINLFNAVLGAWGSILGSPIDVDVLVLWTPLFCEPSFFGAVLGAAGPTFAFGLEGEDFPVHLFHAALAEALLEQDLTGPPEEGGGDLIVFLNSALDDECLGEGTGFYYGLDGSAPGNLFDLAGTLLHEIAHGVGFSNFTDETTGEQFLDTPGVFDFWTFDNTQQKFWDEMTNEERQRSALNFRGVTWEGGQVNAAADLILTPGVPELVIDEPSEVAGTYEIALSIFGPPLPPEGFAGELECFKDGVADLTYLNACSPATNPDELAGKIALIDRGGCAFTTKVLNAQNAGAVGAIIINNAGNAVFPLGGETGEIVIPSLFIGSSDGNKIRQAVCDEVAAFFLEDRFQVATQWATADAAGDGRAVRLTDESGYFWFFDEDNIEVTVKVLDACEDPFNSFWVFAAGMTDVEVSMVVTDTNTGQVKTYFNPLGQPFLPILDTEGFATCP